MKFSVSAASPVASFIAALSSAMVLHITGLIAVHVIEIALRTLLSASVREMFTSSLAAIAVGLAVSTTSTPPSASISAFVNVVLLNVSSSGRVEESVTSPVKFCPVMVIVVVYVLSTSIGSSFFVKLGYAGVTANTGNFIGSAASLKREAQSVATLISSINTFPCWHELSDKIKREIDEISPLFSYTFTNVGTVVSTEGSTKRLILSL